MEHAAEMAKINTLSVPSQQANILNSLFKDTDFTDVALYGTAAVSSSSQHCCETLQAVRAHKVVLAAGSKFFSSLFSNKEFADSNKAEYKLEKVSHEVLKPILEVLYTGEVTDSRIFDDVEVACDMLASLKYLLMDAVALACENILIEHHLTVKNCVFVWKFACKHSNLPKLTTEVEKFIAKSLSKLMVEESFLGMKPDELCRMLLIELVKISTSADARFRAAFVWLEHDADERQKFSDDILASLSLTPGKISRESLKKACGSKAIVTITSAKKLLDLLACSLDVADVDFAVEPDFMPQASSPAISTTNTINTNAIDTTSTINTTDNISSVDATDANNTVDTTSDIKTTDTTDTINTVVATDVFNTTSTIDTTSTANTTNTISSNCFSSPQNEINDLYCVGGHKEKDGKTFLKYNVASKIWHHLDPLPWELYFGGACVVGDRLLTFGGTMNNKLSSVVAECNNLSKASSSSRWSTHQTFQLPRTSNNWLACCVRDNTVYVCGPNKDVFEYTPSTNTWKEKPCMPSERERSSIVYSQMYDAVYVAGGVVNSQPYQSHAQIEKFDVASSKWETIGHATSKRQDLGTALHGDDLYLIAGYQYGNSDTSGNVQKFNIRTGQPGKTERWLRHDRQSCQAALLYNNVVCVFGGDHKSVEAYDVREGKWSEGVVVPDMPTENRYFRIASK